MTAHDYGRALTWGVNRTPDGQRCTVFCLRCRKVLARRIEPHEAVIFLMEYREAMQ